VISKGQGRDPNIVKAFYFENGSRYRPGFNGSPSPSPSIKAVKKFTWRTYALSERLLVINVTIACRDMQRYIVYTNIRRQTEIRRQTQNAQEVFIY